MSLADELASARVRRIITGHDADGRAVIAEDAELTGVGLAEDTERADATFFQVWATHEMPVSLTDEALRAPTRGKRDHGPRHGDWLGAADRCAGARARGRRCTARRAWTTGSAWRASVDLELDGGDAVTVHAGDVVVQRGTNHVWHNRSDAPCRFAWILLDAQPVTIGDRRLGTSWRHDPDPT